MNRYVLFSGCAVERAGAPARRATLALARALHLELWEAPVAGCCGARADRRADAARRGQVLAPLAACARQGLSVACLSPACQLVVATYLAGAAPVDYDPHVHDCAGLLTKADTLAALERALTNPLSSLRIAPHAVCHGDHQGARGRAAPSAAEGAQAPGALPDLLALAGAAVLDDVSMAGHCAAASVEDTPTATRCLSLAAEAGADVLVTPCFLCFASLNRSQQRLRHGDGVRAVPVLHLAQLLGLACGAAPLDLGLAHTTVSARAVLLPLVIRA